MHQARKSSANYKADMLRVHGRLVLDFDLSQILNNLEALRNAKDGKERSQML